MRSLLFPLAALSSAAFLLILRGSVPAEQPPTAPALREKANGIAPGHPKVAEHAGSEDDLIRSILAANDPFEAAEGYRSLFKLVGNDGVARLKMHTSDTIAIQAAWEQVRLTVPEKVAAQPTAPDAGKLAWFLGFLEGRVRVETPAWWADAVRGARATGRDSIYPAMPELNRPYHRAGLDDARAPKGTTLERDDTVAYRTPKVVLRVGKESVRVPEALLLTSRPSVSIGKARASGAIGHVSAAITPTRCYLAVHEDFRGSYRVSGIDRETGMVLWTSDVWGHVLLSLAGRPGSSYVVVTEQGSRVVVFGVSSVGFHVEAFRTDDGTNVFRFSNSYAR